MGFTQKIIDRLSVFFAGFFCALAFQSLAFSEPSSNPPAGNVSAPVNTGPTSQDKGGGNAWITADGLGSRYGALFATISGDVGIGTTSPTSLIDAYGSTNAQSRLEAGTGWSEFDLISYASGAGSWALGTGWSGAGSTRNLYIFDNRGGMRAVIDGNGNVGIGGVKSPVAQLQVSSANNPSEWAGYFTGSDYGVYANANGPSPSWGGEFIGGYGLYAQDTSGYYGEIGNGGYSFYGNGTVYAPNIQAGNGWSGSFQIAASGCPPSYVGTYDLIVTDGVITGHTALNCSYTPPPPPQY
jgi:hypothetical protein